MDFNPEVLELLKSHKINKSAGTLCLLAYYFGLDVETVIPEDVIGAVNVTKIVNKDYTTRTIEWTIPLFAGVDTAFDWVKDWMEAFGRVNPERKGSYRDATSRMKDFFRRYPEYRKDDIYKARDIYFSTLGSSRYCMHSHKFIFDGVGAMKKSTLLAYCEKVRVSDDDPNNYQKGKVVT